MHARSLAKWLVVGALAAIGLGFWGSIAFSQEEAEIAGQNASDDGTADTGSASGVNDSTFATGPSATASGQASSQQDGSNSSTVTQSGSGTSGDPVAGSQVTGVVGNATVQNQNSGFGNTALGGLVTVTNSATAFQGPSATSDDDEALAQQTGSNELDVTQTVTGESGDAVAGSQVTGIAAATEALVQNQNSSEAAFAESGDVVADNFLDVTAGPAAATSGSLAQAGQIGDNDAVLTQSAGAKSGDGVAGSQVTGAVGVDESDFAVQNQNSSESNSGISGDADAFNTAFATLGPSATAVDLFGDSAKAQAGQTGDNQLAADQASGATTGDALGGAQVTGLVSSEEGRLEVRNQQHSEADFAQSGTATADSSLVGDAGPLARAFSGVEEDLSGTFSDDPDAVILVSIDAEGGEAEAQASQIGDNAADVTQVTEATSGDAVAGGQVTGAVAGDGSDVMVQGQSSAADPFAQTGDANASSDVNVNAGPVGAADSGVLVLVGEALIDAFDECFADGCTALAAPNLLIDVTVVGGDARAQASQTGDNAAAVDQTTSADTGDAVAGAQVTGVVTGDDSTTTVANQSSADVPTAQSGFADAVGTADVVAGPLAEADAGAVVDADNNVVIATANCEGDGCEAQAAPFLSIDATVSDVTTQAQASQTGDNSADLAQLASTDSGDAVAGAQVTGAVSGDDAETTVQNQSSAELPLAQTGDATAIIEAFVAAGPEADAFSGASVEAGSNLVSALATCDGLGGSCTASADPFFGVTADVSDADARAQASQTGDNATILDQTVETASGDAVAGGQVTGSVSGDDSATTVQNQSSSEIPTAVSGDASADTFADVRSGAAAFASSGAIVFTDSNTVDAAAFCTGDDCVASTDIFDDPVITITATVTGGFAETQASQTGDNTVDVAQAIDAASGDAVAGAQVTGAVAGDDAEITISGQSSSEEPFAETGTVVAVNDTDIDSGPVSIADTGAVLFADENLATAVASCDGVDCSASALATVVVDATLEAGEAEAQASQIGDNAASAAQSLDAESGDAVAGAQVVGAVAGDDSDVLVEGQNSSSVVTALSGSVIGVNFADIDSGSSAEAITGASVLASDNIVATEAGCIGDGCEAVADAAFTLTADVTGGPSEASASQTGDNVAELGQAATAASGDAVGGAQVTGAVVGEGSEITISGQNSTVDDFVLSGDSDVSNTAFVDGGPSADAVTGADITASDNVVEADTFTAGCVGAGCTSTANALLRVDATVDGGDARAQSSQIGDNAASADQSLDATSGDAVSGSQVAGAVAGSDSEITVSNQNTAELASAFSGNVSGDNDADVTGGPIATAVSAVEVTVLDNAVVAEAFCDGDDCAAEASASAAISGSATGGDAESQASQTGDNTSDIAQSVDASSGDAVAGSQVAGVVAEDGDAQISGQNSSVESTAFTGDALTSNTADTVLGPQSTASTEATFTEDTVVFAFADCVGAGCTADSFEDLSVDFTTEDGTTRAQASQTGDNAATVDQGADASTGDAVSGSQVTGIVGADGPTLVQNSDELSSASTGIADVLNSATGALGPLADSPSGDASSQHSGDSDGAAEQTFTVETGDALVGSQVSGAVE